MKFPLSLIAGIFSWVGCLTMYWFYLKHTGDVHLNLLFSSAFFVLGGMLFIISALTLKFSQALGFKNKGGE